MSMWPPLVGLFLLGNTLYGMVCRMFPYACPLALSLGAAVAVGTFGALMLRALMARWGPSCAAL